MKHFIKSCVLTVAVSLIPFAATADEWKPSGPIKLMIGFGAGGGADTQARLIAEAIEAKTGWKILPTQETGNSGLNLLTALKKEPADGTAIGMGISETLTYNLIAAEDSGLSLDQFTPLATTAAFQLGLVAMAKGDFSSWDKLKAAAAAGKKIRFGTATTRQADLAYSFSKGAGLDFNIISVKGGKAIMNGLRAGDMDIGWVAGAQAKAVAQGEMTNIARAIPTPIRETPNAPSITDLGSEFYLDGYFMFMAPGNMDPAAREAISKAINDVLIDPKTDAAKLVTKAFGGPTVITGDDLDDLLNNASEDARKLLNDIAE